MPEYAARAAAVAVGFFDGVHRGHQAILRAAGNEARVGGYRNVVLTFDRHPMDVIDPGRRPHLLMTRHRRVRALAAAANADVRVLCFGDALRRRTPDEFVDEFLVERLAARHVVVGANFRFGARATGDVQKLRDLGASRGFAVTASDLLEVGGRVVSSTAIRAAIHDGHLAVAAGLLGHPYAVDGVAVCGREETRAGRILVAVPWRMALPASGSFSGRLLTLGGRSIACTLDVLPSDGRQWRWVEAQQMTDDQALPAGRVMIELDLVDRFGSAPPTTDREDVAPPAVETTGLTMARGSRPRGA